MSIHFPIPDEQILKLLQYLSAYPLHIQVGIEAHQYSGHFSLRFRNMQEVLDYRSDLELVSIVLYEYPSYMDKYS